MPDPKHIQTQINYARIQGNLVVHGDATIQEAQLQFPRILTRLPRLREKLIGREGELKDLATQLQSGQNLLLMNGMGGVGKTTLATAYANQLQERYTHICWLEQQGDFANSLVTDGDLLNSLRYEPTDDPQQDAKNLLNRIGELGKGHKSLLVIDNAEANLKDYFDYLPTTHWEVLVTSRQKIYGFEELGIDNLTAELAKELFFHHYQLDQEEETVYKIIELLDGHTLTLELLAKTAQTRRIQPLNKVYNLLQEHGLAIGRRLGKEIAHNKGEKVDKIFSYLQTIFQWSETTDEETWLLKQFLFLPPNYHSFEFLAEALLIVEKQEAEWDQLSDTLDCLVGKGWLTHDVKLGFKLHRVLKGVLLVQLKEKLVFQDVIPLINGIKHLIEYDQDTDNPIHRFYSVSYGEILLDTLPSSWREKELVASLQDELGQLFRDLGRFVGAEKLATSALRTILKIYGENHVKSASYQSNLALIYQDLGEYKEALKLAKLALDLDEKEFGANHFRTAIRQSVLGSIYQDLEQPEEGVRLLEFSLKTNIAHYGLDHPSVAMNLSNLALVYQDLGESVKAQHLLEQALNSDMKNFGPDHPNTTTRQSNLALVYRALGHYAQAAELLEFALESDERNYGIDHPNTAIRQSNLAGVYVDLGRIEEAKSLARQSIATFEKILGQDHPNTRNEKEWLANLES